MRSDTVRSQINQMSAANVQEDFLVSPFLMSTVLSNRLPHEHLHRLTLGHAHGGSTAGRDLLYFLQVFCSTSLPQLWVSSQLTPSKALPVPIQQQKGFAAFVTGSSLVARSAAAILFSTELPKQVHTGP